MLLELHIRNFALIDSADIEFGSGLNILTGETGAGKSILIDSVNFVLGEKQNKDIIRTGQDSAYVEGVFECKNSELCKILTTYGIDCEDILIIAREINQSGRTVSRVNGKTVTLNILKQISSLLIDIHGQHEHQSLLDEGTHIDVLDSFCSGNFSAFKQEYKDLYIKVKDIEKEIEKLTSDEQYKLRRMDLLNFQIKEISDAKLKISEDEELIKRRDVLSNAEKIYSTLASIYQELYEGDNRECAYDKIGTSIVHLESIEKYDENLKRIRTSIEDIYYKLEDLIDEIRNYKDSLEFDSSELDQIEMRLDLINKLKRKYGGTITEILDYNEKIKEELSQIEKSEEIIEELAKKNEEYKIKLYEIANEMTYQRKSAADKLSKLIEDELKYLGMDKATFKIEVNENEKLGENGKDNVFFTMSANPGEPLKPLSKVASGGEMSRIMLAIKTVIADIDKIPTLIFDEIDTGISGRTAQAVAEKMSQISSKHQLLCVTHLPQIASMADIHFKIEKQVIDNKTSTNVFRLRNQEQIEELARMLGGAVVTELTKNHAREMIELAGEIKKKLR